LNILHEVKKLEQSRLLSNNNEVMDFESAIENILSVRNYKYIKYLCMGLDDDTEDEEVMYGLVHAIESYYKIVGAQKYFKEFINAIIHISDNAREWIKLLNIRILNDENSLKEYMSVVKKSDQITKSFLIKIMQEIKVDDSAMFSESVDQFLKSI